MIIYILGVDGVSNTSFTTRSPSEALRLLKIHDHEGSGVTMVIEDNEEVYQMLRTLAFMGRPWRGSAVPRPRMSD